MASRLELSKSKFDRVAQILISQKMGVFSREELMAVKEMLYRFWYDVMTLVSGVQILVHLRVTSLHSYHSYPSYDSTSPLHQCDSSGQRRSCLHVLVYYQNSASWK